MEMYKLDILSKQVGQAMDSGDLDHAQQLANEIRNMAKCHIASAGDSRFLVNTGGLLIHVGNESANQEMIQEGVELLQRNLEKLVNDSRYVAIVHYKLGNGYSSLFSVKKKKEPMTGFFRDSDLNLARSHYEKALECDPEKPLLSSQIWVNLGICFDNIGRVLDALECYERAIALKPDHSMALGNKGIGLYIYARVAGEHQVMFLREAYALLSKALEQGVPATAASHFERYLRRIKSRFVGREDDLAIQQDHLGITIGADSEIEKFLITFCLQNNLYLNICHKCQCCNGAVGDSAVIKKMVVPIRSEAGEDWLRDDLFLRLSAYLNQIKQDYVTARFLLTLSRYKKFNLNQYAGL